MFDLLSIVGNLIKLISVQYKCNKGVMDAASSTYGFRFSYKMLKFPHKAFIYDRGVIFMCDT